MKKIFLITSLILVITYLISYGLFAQKQLEVVILENNNATYKQFKWTDTINFITNRKILQSQKLSNSLFGNNKKVEHYCINDEDELKKLTSQKNIYNYLLLFHKKTFITDFDEIENIAEYASFWQRQYLWFFFKWIEIKNHNVGTS